jgi:hypothetical protein
MLVFLCRVLDIVLLLHIVPYYIATFPLPNSLEPCGVTELVRLLISSADPIAAIDI